MPPEIDYAVKSIRAAAILTNAFVAGTVIGQTPPIMARRYNQLVILAAFTLGSLTTADLKVEFSQDGATWYQESDETNAVASNVNTRSVNTVLHEMTLTGNYRFLVNIADNFVRISAKGNGTVTSSSLQIDVNLVKNFA